MVRSVPSRFDPVERPRLAWLPSGRQRTKATIANSPSAVVCEINNTEPSAQYGFDPLESRWHPARSRAECECGATP